MVSRFLIYFTLFLLVVACDDDTDDANNVNNLNNVNNTSNTNNTNNTNNVNNTNNTTTNNVNNVNNVVTTPANQNKSVDDAMQKIFPGYTHEPDDLLQDVYVAKEGDTIVGVGIMSSHFGYISYVRTMAFLNTLGETLAVETISQNESESYWNLFGESFFQQFQGILFQDVTLMPNYNDVCNPWCDDIWPAIGDVDAVSYATISSDAIIKNMMKSYLIYDTITF